MSFEGQGTYFEESGGDLKVELGHTGPGEGGLSLREAQAGAYWAVRSHFTARNDPALVVMPTGSGKTALMTLVALGIARKRVLIIAPSRVIREQIADEFENLTVARATGCIPSELPAPRTQMVRRQLSSVDLWQDLEQFDVVVATPKCVSPAEAHVFPYPPPNLFDTVLFDEAHHMPATTWDALVDQFEAARVITFTATPYRNDKRPLPGEIVYAYPLARAIDRGIYRAIEFVAVEGHGDRAARDLRLARRATEVLAQERKKGPAKLIVRIDRIAEMDVTRSLYEGEGVALETVHSDRSWLENKAAIAKVVHDEGCDGLISVGMLGEGLDLPVLRVAVMHRPHQSFPVTLQFIGRICRATGSEGATAKLLAIPEDVQEHTRGLYELDANWAKLIPNLSDAAVGREQARRRFTAELVPSRHANKVSVHTLRPSFAVTVYQVEGDTLDLSPDPELPANIELFQSEHSVSHGDQEWRVLITRSAGRPVWTTSESLLEVRYGLLVYCRIANLLFEYASWPGVAQQARQAFAGRSPGTSLKPISRERIEQVISQGGVSAYYNVGMRRVSHSSSTVPSYKVMIDTHAEDAVRQADGRFFTVGHLFGRIGTDDDALAVGISSDRARVWASARDHLKEFVEWCELLAARLGNNMSVPLPHLDHLRRSTAATVLQAEPYAACFHEKFFEQLEGGLIFEFVGSDGQVRTADGHCEFELSVVEGSWDPAAPSRCLLTLVAGDVEAKVRYDLAADDLFGFEPTMPWVKCLAKVPYRGQSSDCELQEYLAEFAPVVHLADGSSIQGRSAYLYSPSSYPLPQSLLCHLNWSQLDCAIEVEDRSSLSRERQQEIGDRPTVLEAAALLVPDLLAGGTVIYNDHHAGEIADYVAVEPLGEGIRVHLFHCKASSDPIPGARQGDAYAVVAQALKCVRWLRKSDLFDVILSRAQNHPERVAQGSVEQLAELLQRGSPQTADYTVHVVQPGFDLGRIAEWHDESIRLIMLSLYDELACNDVKLSIIGS